MFSETKSLLSHGPNPTTSIYNASVVIFYKASVVIFYNATGSLARFENIFFVFEKRSNLLQRWRCSCKLALGQLSSVFLFLPSRVTR
jgi:hypothetical protein